ncbi:MAG: PD-(D/E)XK nuclease family protein [Lachnospiraceae bacterium]|nr:PD-(D/E)XK nuclease family protein [Lachnospiraceae bacterium]
MSLSFIYGPAGSGKSIYVQDELIRRSTEEPGRNFILIVPDQFTMQTQADIVKRHPRQGIMNVDVLSFGRLSYRIFEDVGSPDEAVLDDTGKSLVIRHVASLIAEKMPYIGKNLSKVGYVHEVKSAISEFMQYRITVQDLRTFAEKSDNSLLKVKMNDLAVIYEEFLKYNKDRFITNEETLDILCKRLPLSPVVKDAVIVFDGFTGFTPVQERVIETLLSLACEVWITVTCAGSLDDLKRTGSEDLFNLSAKTVRRLESLKGIERGRDVDAASLNGGVKRFTPGSGLEHLERSLFRFPLKPMEKESDDITIFAAENIKTEVDEICLRILDLVMDQGYEYRDIAVVTGNLENYGDLFERRFEELSIPSFIDRTRSIVLNPFTEYLKSALRMIIMDYSYDSVFHFLRSGFTDFDLDEVDRLDIYIRGLNIRGAGAYHKDFKRRPKGTKRNDYDIADLQVLERNKTREKLAKTMEPLEREAKTAGEYVKNLYEFLVKNGSFDKLKTYSERFEEMNDLSKSREYAQIYRLIMGLLDTIVALVGDEEMSLDEFYKIFEAGINEISVGTIPQNVDRIVVGDIERTRLKEVKALFFAGLNDGNVPKNKDAGGILSSRDRKAFKELFLAEHKELAPTPDEDMYSQKLYLYMNMCKPTQRLILSYAGTDREGKGLKPSYLIGNVKKMFPYNEIAFIEDSHARSRIGSLSDSFRHFAALSRDVAAGIANDDERVLVQALYDVYGKLEKRKTRDDELEAAFTEYDARALSRAIVDKIYGDIMVSSISRMELFAKCGYAHFLKYGMALQTTAENEFNAADLGNVYHGVLDIFSKKLKDRGLTWKSFTKEQGEELVEESVAEFVDEYEQGILNDDAKREYTKIKITRMLKRTVDTLQFQLLRGKFMPVGFEQSFQRQIELDDGSMLKLTGKIDRIDLYEKDGEIFVKILDYKSSSHSIDISSVYYGLQQQLGIYMAETLEKQKQLHPDGNIHPAAILYYALDNPFIDYKDGMSEDDINDSIRKELKMKGLVEKDPELYEALDEGIRDRSMVLPVNLKKDGEPDKYSVKNVASEEEMYNFIDYTQRMTKRIGNLVKAGKITISPVSDNPDACKYCDYKGICRFDEKIPGFKKRDNDEVDSETIQKSVMGGDTDGDYLF